MINELNYSDRNRGDDSIVDYKNKYSKYCDKIYYTSRLDPKLKLCMLVYKPEKPSYILATTHGWHMTIPDFSINEDKPSPYLLIFVDMRGRKKSMGYPDCNGYELIDIIDAIEYCKIHYKEYLLSTDVVYFEGGSGGGGNAYGIIAKFPDYFASVNALCGISDYATWFQNDKIGEFKDEMEPWIGTTPDVDKQAYQSRSGIYGVKNIYTHVFISHGHDDIRVPCYHAQKYVEEAIKVGKKDYIKYWEVPHTGGMDHWTNITKENQAKLDDLCEENRINHRTPIELPRKGKLVILGYLITKYFEVYLDNQNTVAEIEYDIDKNAYNVISKGNYKYRLIKK